MKRTLFALITAALAAFFMPAAAQMVIPTGAPGSTDARVRPESNHPNLSDIGAFRTDCAFSHMASDDPIVHWGQPGGSHPHTFFGNSSADYKSTWESLGAGASTCPGGRLNRSAYWVPTMMDRVTGQLIAPKAAQVYYKTGYLGVKPADVQAFPDRLRMVAGDMHSAGPQGVAGFFCLATGINSKELPGSCPVGSEMWSKVTFPQCWDGKNLDSDDHKSHMAYGTGSGCPATHPVALPEVSINAIYVVPPGGAASWELASDHYDASLPRGYSMHADWFGRWDRKTQMRWVTNCLRTSSDCRDELLGDGFELF